MKGLWVLLILGWLAGAALFYWLFAPPCPRLVFEGTTMRCVP